jgi:hypothetical protein
MPISPAERARRRRPHSVSQQRQRRGTTASLALSRPVTAERSVDRSLDCPSPPLMSFVLRSTDFQTPCARSTRESRFRSWRQLRRSRRRASSRSRRCHGNRYRFRYRYDDPNPAPANSCRPPRRHRAHHRLNRVTLCNALLGHRLRPNCCGSVLALDHEV